MSPSTDRRIGSDAHVAVWAAIQQYVVACGGDPNQVTDGRMDAVVAIERAVDRRAAELNAAAIATSGNLDLTEIDRVEQAMTPGPWFVEQKPRFGGAISVMVDGLPRQVAEANGQALVVDEDPAARQIANAAGIVVLRNQTRALITEIQTLRLKLRQALHQGQMVYEFAKAARFLALTLLPAADDEARTALSEGQREVEHMHAALLTLLTGGASCLLDLLPQVTPQQAATWTRQNGMACRVEVEDGRFCVYVSGRGFQRGSMRWHIDDLALTDLGCPAQLEAANDLVAMPPGE